MIILGKDKVMDDEFIRKLNNAVDIIVQEKDNSIINYNLMEEIMRKVVINAREYKLSPRVITIMKKEEIIKTVLDFFETIDNEFYQKAKEVLLQNNKNIKMNIYDLYSITDFSIEDEYENKEYTRDGSVCAGKGNAIVHLPLKEELKPKEAKVLDENTGTLDDCFAGVHEIAHLFDLNLKDTLPAKGRLLEETKYKMMYTRIIFSESTAITFEKLFTEYVLNNTKHSKETIRYIAQSRINNTLGYAKRVYIRLLLSKEKINNKEITLNYIEEIMRNNNISIMEMRNVASDIIDYPKDLLWESKYAIAGLISPTIVNRYKNEGVEVLKRYLKEIKEDNFNGVLQILGIEKSEKGLNELIKTKKIQEESFTKDEQK